MKKPYYNQEQRMIMRSDTWAGDMFRAAFAMDKLRRALDMLPKKKPPPLWLRRLLS